MVELARQIVTDDRAARSMLFAVQPPSPAVSQSPDITALQWINGRGGGSEIADVVFIGVCSYK